jgi:uncharacterized protein YjbI with pentapeptide repeats
VAVLAQVARTRRKDYAPPTYQALRAFTLERGADGWSKARSRKRSDKTSDDWPQTGPDTAAGFYLLTDLLNFDETRRSRSEIPHVYFHNVKLTDLDIRDVRFLSWALGRVTFENCVFKDVAMEDTTLIGRVQFVSCRFENVTIGERIQSTNVRLGNVLLKGTKNFESLNIFGKNIERDGTYRSWTPTDG